MKLFSLSTALLLTTGAVAQAQNLTPSPLPAAVVHTQKERYTAANDSLMLLVSQLHTDAEARMRYFKSSMGDASGPHRRVKAYAKSFSGTVDFSGTKAPSGVGLVRKQVVKRRSGIELEKVAYYDAKGRNILQERYEDHRLIRLEAFEYNEVRSHPASRWLFMRGNYLKHVMQPSSATAARKTFVYFDLLPAPTSKQ
ncbi:hypothetical protein [Hymenobacter properus]|uniref:Uncharacterized protein n=1 Tax=Hymenobacter properus TaxID=2791026 RepID=A0A931BFI6_9BACT|nr:hypothetical protein [Hymenobacter properus]MBF9142970.1 hypothetical protein [Hymenobacter properus]MBR7721777.1 hypothetical protein [Microvirga sp. SRT04]